MKSSEKLSYKVIAQKLHGKGLPSDEKNVGEKILSTKRLYTFWKEKVEAVAVANRDNKWWDKILKVILLFFKSLEKTSNICLI